MFIKTTESYTIYRTQNAGPNSNPNMIITFPTSRGHKHDMFQFGVLQSLMNENIVFLFMQTRDQECFYDPKLSDEEKTRNLETYLNEAKEIIDEVKIKYEPMTRRPILIGCSMGGYYAQLFFMKYPNQFDCISLGGFCDVSLMDRHADHMYQDDKTIDYWAHRDLWDRYNPCCLDIDKAIPLKNTNKIFSCFGVIHDQPLMRSVYEFCHRLETYSIDMYIKQYDLCHDFHAWGNMVRDIFKGTTPEFHDFRLNFYHDHDHKEA